MLDIYSHYDLTFQMWGMVCCMVSHVWDTPQRSILKNAIVALCASVALLLGFFWGGGFFLHSHSVVVVDLFSLLFADSMCGEEWNFGRNMPECGLHSLQSSPQQLAPLPHGSWQGFTVQRHWMWEKYCCVSPSYCIWISTVIGIAAYVGLSALQGG